MLGQSRKQAEKHCLTYVFPKDMMKQITFQKAKSEEINTVLLLLKEAALWLREKSIDYWQDWINPPDPFVNWIRQGFDQGQFYMVQSGEKTIGCFRLQWQDPIFWGEQEDNAGYIHSFTISRDLAGQGIGVNTLYLIEAYCRKNKKSFFRLDCGADAKGLRNYY